MLITLSPLGEGRGGGPRKDIGVFLDIMDDFHRANADWYGLLKEYAKRMRKNPTEAENVLWGQLRNKSLGVKFQRQCVILDFIADFYAPELCLIIEVDGGYHNRPEQMFLDAERTQRLEAKGYNILRFTNEAVLFDTEKVVQQIIEYINI